MNETAHHALSILLPEARVAVYSKDGRTLESARAATHDWRFARVRIAAENGTVDTAIEFYKNQPSPDLIIVETDTIDDTLTQKLETLAGHCSENTAAVVIGPVNDVYLYRRLIEMGVSDYLVGPLDSVAMAEVIAKTLVERLGVSASRLIAFIGAKGGVGTSALAQGAAVGVADILSQKTAFLDCAGGWSDMSIGFDIEPATTLAEAAAAAVKEDEDALTRMLHKAGENLTILASGADALLDNVAPPGAFEGLLDRLLLKYPVVIADLSHAEPELSRTVLNRANQIVIVSTPSLPSLRLARALAQEVKALRGGEEESFDLVINMQGRDRAAEVPAKDIEKAMEMKISAAVPFAQKAFLLAESAGKTLVSDKEGRAIVEEILLPVLKKSISAPGRKKEENAPAGFLGGVLGKLKIKN